MNADIPKRRQIPLVPAFFGCYTEWDKAVIKMLDKEDLQAIAQLMDSKLRPIDTRMDSIEKQLDSIDKRIITVEKQLSEMQENTQVTRGAVNTLLEWADDASVQAVPLLHRKKSE